MLACMAPAEYGQPLEEGLAAVGLRVCFFSGNGELRRTAAKASRDADALLVVAPRNKSLRTAAPGPVVEGLPVGLLHSNRSEDLTPWLEGFRGQERGSRELALMAMACKSYLTFGAALCRVVTGGGSRPGTVVAG